MLDSLQQNLISPLTLAFALGVVARLVKSELSIPRDVYAAISIYLLLALGLKGGVELAHSSLTEIFWPACATIVLGCVTPITSYVVCRSVGRLSIADSAGLAAHYGSVSAVTFIAAQQFVGSLNVPLEGFMPTLLTLMESPGIHIGLAIGAVQMTRGRLPVSPSQATPPDPTGHAREASATAAPSLRRTLHEILTARSMILLVGGLIVGFLLKEKGYEPVKPFYEGMFKGALTIFLLEMGLVAGSRLNDLRKVGSFLLGFGIVMPVIHGAIAVVLGHWSGLSVGGCTVLAAMAASASYIAAPPAVRMTFPEANPTYYLTASLAITFPFNLVAGIPLYYQLARFVAS